MEKEQGEKLNQVDKWEEKTKCTWVEWVGGCEKQGEAKRIEGIENVEARGVRMRSCTLAWEAQNDTVVPEEEAIDEVAEEALSPFWFRERKIQIQREIALQYYYLLNNLVERERKIYEAKTSVPWGEIFTFIDAGERRE